MMGLLESLWEILEEDRLVESPVTLEERAETSRCAPLQLRGTRSHFALRLQSDDHLRVLAPLTKERSVRKLPDYLVFCEPARPAESAKDTALLVLVCELKSGAAGTVAARPQVQLGKLLAEYLSRIAAHALGQSDAPKLWCSGLVISPELPSNLIPKGSTRPGKVELPGEYDELSKMRIHYSRGGQDLFLESVFGM